jgi:hypothetical protein
MPILRKLIFTVAAAAALLAAPSAAFASTASPAAPAALTRAAAPVSIAKPANPCLLTPGKPHLVHVVVNHKKVVKAQLTATITCDKPVQRLSLGIALSRDGKLVAWRAIPKSNVKGLTLTVGKACRNHNRGSFTGRIDVRVEYRGHNFSGSRGSGPVTLACGF